MAYVEPSVTDFKTYFVRDFPFGTDINKNILDSDISRAISDADAVCNQDLFSDQNQFTSAFMNLAAHYLVTNLRASSQGVSGTFSWLESSKSVGSVSESFSIPQSIMENPVLAMLAKTNYGAKYLSIIVPYLTGAVYSVSGGTNP